MCYSLSRLDLVLSRVLLIVLQSLCFICPGLVKVTDLSHMTRSDTPYFLECVVLRILICAGKQEL